MFIDLHTHEELFSPCSRMTLEEAVAAARQCGLDGLCITDHDSMEIRKEAGEYLSRPDFPVFIGVEMSAEEGDILAFGLTEFPGKIYRNAQEIIDLVNQQNGFCYVAHPYRFYNANKFLRSLNGLHGLEAYNGGNTKEANRKAVMDCQALRLAALGGSDAHVAWDVGSYATWFPKNISTESELVAALKSGTGRPAVLENGRYKILDLTVAAGVQGVKLDA
jgi:predicted metal-dependent phosphoesterase TrpH